MSCRQVKRRRPMAVDDDPNNSNTVVKCICSDKKVVEVDRKTWELFNKMVPKEGFHRIREPVEMYFVRSTAFKKILTYCVRISDGTYSERWMYDELLHSESLKILMRDLRFWLWISWESWLLDLERIWLRAALRTFS
ncbi:hypothetical protein HID58_058040 [Brassica napus]|uniref:Uncharacterized protein n=1 Tax=Brassica napus TaxID=3708 RepID=A0ABQ7ZP14_BRANA|nr:hypothetical protein HID58_058040 [Brassica napus]